jgi:hypothetical protein
MKNISHPSHILKFCDFGADCTGNFSNPEFPLAVQLSPDRCTLKLQYVNLTKSSHVKEYILELLNPCDKANAIVSPKGSFILLILQNEN